MVVIIVVTLFLLNPIVGTLQAEAPAPGSADDPVITKSYFDKNTLTEEKVKQLISAAVTTQGNTVGSGTGSIPTGKDTSSTQTSSITIVQLKTGQTLYAGEGTEIIVRTGKTVAISNDENGIPDVTSGKDIAAGSTIETNHMLIFPREGRGIKPDPKSNADIYVMVRGGYLILNADGSKVQ
jgi:hypothetical protein